MCILKIIIENDRVHLDEINNSSLISNDDKIILLSSSLIINKDYEKAKSLINNYNYKSNSTISSLYIYSIDGSQIKYKNPIITGSL